LKSTDSTIPHQISGKIKRKKITKKTAKQIERLDYDNILYIIRLQLDAWRYRYVYKLPGSKGKWEGKSIHREASPVHIYLYYTKRALYIYIYIIRNQSICARENGQLCIF